MKLIKEKVLLLLSILPLYFICATAPARGGSVHAFRSGQNCYGECKLPDTGQTQCYDNQATPVAGACPGGGNGTGPAGQDGAYSPTASSPSYTLNGDGTVTDNVTGLMWVSNSGAVTYTWANALSSCTATTAGNLNYGSGYAGHTDWRLPNVRELMSIVNYGAAAAPRINTTAFPGTQSGAYWTATTYVPVTTGALLFYFNDATLGYDGKQYGYYVRCVRGGK